MRTAISNVPKIRTSEMASGTVTISGIGNTVAWVPGVGGAPTINPFPFERKKTELRFGFPNKGGDGVKGYHATPVHWMIVPESPTAHASCEFTWNTEFRLDVVKAEAVDQTVPS